MSQAVSTSWNKEKYNTREEWKDEMSKSDVIMQWDPDHEPFTNEKYSRRAIQLGIRNNMLKRFGQGTDSAILDIEDITDFVKATKSGGSIDGIENLELPVETIYPLNKELYHRLALEDNDDDFDRQLFSFTDNHLVVEQILRIKHNSSQVKCMKLTDLSQYTGNWDEEEWKRLGVILGHNIYVEELKLIGDNRQNLNVSDLFIGLQMNQHISKLSLVGINLGGNAMKKLAPFLSNNPLLKKIELSGCTIGSSGIDTLSNALLGRSEDSLENIDLNGNNFGDINLDMLVRSLIKCSRLKLLLLNDNGIGINGCTSLANLLKNGESNLAHIDLRNNLIDNKCFIALTSSLARNKNTTLKTLQLWGNEGITASGWMALLKLVCNFRDRQRS